jgi:DNA-binding winged helix-turn-helix (wHTH) protein/tetratricopeptide (TPR) repeat protein
MAFGDCELSIERLELRRDGERVPLEPQVFDVLAFLVAHRDRVVAKTELLDEVWGDRFVSESALTSRIKSVRRAIGDTGRDQRIIRTVHGRGYRFVADVLDTGSESAATPVRPPLAMAGAPAPMPAPAPADPVTVRVGQVLDRLAVGQGSALRIEGGTRAARTEILDTLADAARPRSVAVGLALPSVTDASPFACLAGALDEMTQRQPELLDALPGSCRTELQQVFRTGLPTTRQRWLVAVRELLAVAAEASGALVLIDHADHASPETLALVDDVARLSRAHRVAVVMAGRPPSRPEGWSGAAPAWFEVVTLPGAIQQTLQVLDLPADVLAALRQVAVAGDRFDELELQAATGHGEAIVRRLVELAVAGGAVVPEAGAFRLARGLDAEVLTGEVADHQRSRTLECTARGLASLGAPPARVAERFLSAGCATDAAPYALAAARGAAAVQLHGEVLRWTDVARGGLSGPDEAERLLLRADALAGVGDPSAVGAFRAALTAGDPAEAGALRARLARAALYVGDPATAADALAGIEAGEDTDDAAVLYVKGLLAYYTGDIDAAEALVDEARTVALARGTPKQVLDAITLQGLVAHNRGEWFDRLRRELRSTSEDAVLASTVFDSHLCVAEFLLYGPTPYAEVIELASRLRAQADEIGARPAAAFATVVIGEAALLAGDLDVARSCLSEAVEQHAAIGADSGTSHALQRLAELELLVGNRTEAEQLLRRALVLARWSPLAHHLLQRIYGTLIAAAPDRGAALAALDEAVAASDKHNPCGMCHVMIAVPAAIACAEGGRLDEAHSWLVQAEMSAAQWHGTAWQGAVREARAHVTLAAGAGTAVDDARGLLVEAAGLFDAAGQPLDAQRCRESAETLSSS